jgi:hypothetical protein
MLQMDYVESDSLMSSGLIDQIVIPAESQRLPGWALLAIGILFFSISIPFLRLLVIEFIKSRVSLSSIVTILIPILMLNGLNVWLWKVYSNAKEISLSLFEDRLEVSSARLPIPIKDLEAMIGQVKIIGVIDGIVVDPEAGDGLIISVKNLNTYLKPNFTSQLGVVYGEPDRLRFLIDRMIARDVADRFVTHIQELKIKK